MPSRKTTRERWKQALAWEKAFWDKYISMCWGFRSLRLLKTIAKCLVRDGPGDAGNYWWAKQFNDYEFVPSEVGNVVEFGCGPFTNLRLILKGRRASHAFASDPLAKHYVGYRGFQLAKKWKRREYLIDDHMLEEAPFASDYFDLAICINVLDHVQDVYLCMKQLTRVVSPGGVVIFGQDLTSEKDLRETSAERQAAGDVGHPHTFADARELLAYFDDFETILGKQLTREQGRLPRWHFGTLIYAGRKRAGGATKRSS